MGYASLMLTNPTTYVSIVVAMSQAICASDSQFIAPLQDMIFKYV
eukprot:CAMPEP_0179368408 /NCGR_PEP_ID=MMETSP0797-20121207/84088_1 /TAXON_ID=47934 /ORGANISM="Dinophysis acuminata, Strain DAEP01" /LENGTH=44 /DNA_ID= /DNA_START= /DNA_END= /DNA_ORIENTATION=